MSPWTVGVLAQVWPTIIESLGETKRSLWAALSHTQPVGVDKDVVTIGFVRRSDADILRKPQGPGSPLPNADLLRDAIYAATGHRVRFTVEELATGLQPGPPSAESSSWPVVTTPGSEVSETALDEATLDGSVENDVTGSTKVSDPPADHAPSDASEKPGGETREENTADEGADVTGEKRDAPAGDSSAEDPSAAAPTVHQVLGQRGEPAIRAILGGELIAEEILEQPRADKDV